jgi:tripartite motif-containing protein 71
MAVEPKSVGVVVLRLIAILGLLGWPRVGSAQGKWSVISLPPTPGEVVSPRALALDAAGNLYVADTFQIQKRDAQGHWAVIATDGTPLGQVSAPSALAVDGAGNLYVVGRDGKGQSWIQERDAQGNWSILATPGEALGQVSVQGDVPISVAVDGAGNLYVADRRRIQKRDALGNWSVLATGGAAPGQVLNPTALAADSAGNLYVALAGNGARIQKRDAQGRWSILAPEGASALAADSAGNLYVADPYGPGRIWKWDAKGNWLILNTQVATALAADTAGNLYVAEVRQDDGSGNLVGVDRVQQRDAQGNWSALTTIFDADAAGEVINPTALAMDTAGTLYVAEQPLDVNGEAVGVDRIQQRDAQGNWSVIATVGYDLGQVSRPTALTVDTAGNLYVPNGVFRTEGGGFAGGGIQKRDPQGNWSVVASGGNAFGEVHDAKALAADAAGNLYVADHYYVNIDIPKDRIQKRDAQGNWSVIADYGASALAVDSAGNLYVASDGGIQKRDAQGDWSQIDDGQITSATALAVDTAGNLYVEESNYTNGFGRIHKRDAQGNWSVIATWGADLGQVSKPSGLAVDSAGNLYVADTGNNRVLKYTPGS